MDLSGVNVPLIIALAAFLVICLVVMGIVLLTRQKRERQKIIEKIQGEGTDWASTRSDFETASITAEDAASKGVIKSFLKKVGSKANPGRTMDDRDIKLKFLRAGLRDRNTPTAFWGVKFLLGLFLPLIFAFYVIGWNPSMELLHAFLIAAALGLIGLFIPDYWLLRKTASRRDRIVKAFPDALDMLVVCVEAGMGLDAALGRVGKELELGYPDLSDELNFLNLELRAGKARSAALKNMAERINVDDVHSLVTLLLQTDKFGTSVGQALRVFSDTFRTQRYQRAEEEASKIATKLLFPLVLCIFPAMFVVILGPVAIKIFRVFSKI